MTRRLFLTTFFITVLIGTLGLLSRVQTVEASGTIYIRADGSIDPSDAPISTFDNVTYTLTGDITSDADGIVIERDNIVIDGADYTVTGSGGGSGTTLTNRTHVTVRNMTIKNFYNGIFLDYSSNNTLSGNNVLANNGTGIQFFYYSTNNILSGNNVTANNGYGIWFHRFSDNNTLSGNVMGGNRYNFGVASDIFFHTYLQSVDTSNLVDGKPIYYFVNQSNFVVNAAAYPEIGYLAFVNCANVTVQGLTLTGNGQGLLLAFTNDSKITGNNLANNLDGIFLDYCTNNNLSGNNIANNSYGVVLSSSSNNTISGNNITATKTYGIYLYSSFDNSVFHNSFVNNTNLQVYAEGSNNTTWDDGYPSGGNYWSDYTGTDLYCGLHQNETGSDGIGDTPYTSDFPWVNDRYPLMVQYVIPEFPSLLILPIFFIVTLLAVIVCRRKHVQRE